MEHKELVKFMGSIFYPLNSQAHSGSFFMANMPAKVEGMPCIFLKAIQNHSYVKCSILRRRKSEHNHCACFFYGGSKHPGEMPFLRAPNLLGCSPSVSEPGPHTQVRASWRRHISTVVTGVQNCQGRACRGRRLLLGEAAF